MAVGESECRVDLAIASTFVSTYGSDDGLLSLQMPSEFLEAVANFFAEQLGSSADILS